MHTRLIGPLTATLLVVASMVGAGAFTTTGMLLSGLESPIAALIAWLVGGMIALFGALSYAELVAALPRNGGEYQLLSRLYHPTLGFVAGWISLVVGFSAPIAATALAFGTYLEAIMPSVNSMVTGLVLIIVLSVLHGARVRLGGGVQNVFTIAKVLIILVFICVGLFSIDTVHLLDTDAETTLKDIISPGFAIGLIFVSFAYSGWNGAAYLAGEIRDPARSLPLALAGGTSLVMLLYLGLNIVFLGSGPSAELVGQEAVGHVAAVNLFGDHAGKILSGVISLLLVSSVSAMIMTGPRVYQAIGQDHETLKFLRIQGEGQGPVYAIALQAVVAIVMLLTSSFGALLTYIGFTLSIFAGLTVYGVFHLRRREPDLPRPYRVWGYPWTPAMFIALSAWMVIYTLIERPLVAVSGLLTVGSGLVVHKIILWRERSQPRNNREPNGETLS